MGLVSRFPNRGEFYGMLAFAGTGVGAFSTYLFANRINGTVWELAVTFLAGAAFILLGSFSTYFVDEKTPRECLPFMIVQTVLVVGAIWISPLRGFFGIIALPLASQAIFILPWLPALLWGIGLYLATCFLYFPDHGWSGFWEALLSYSPGYLFTMVFSFITRDALFAREKAMDLSTQLESANARLRAQAAQTEELATTRERNRLAREIHDGVGHYLTVINVQLEAARAVCTKDPAKATAALDKAARLSREALEDVRRSVGTLRTDDQRPPLADAIRALTHDSALSLPVELSVSGSPRPLSSAAEHALFRAAQEGLTNVRKHARARQARLHLDFSDAARIRLQVQDDGPGPEPDTPATAASDGFGLRGMRERIGLLGGDVQAGPRPEGGFSLTVDLPA